MQHLGQQGQHGRANDRAEHGPGSAEQHRKQEEHRAEELEIIGTDIVLLVRKQRTAETGEGCADDEDHDLQAIDVNADGSNRNFAVFDGAKAQPEIRVNEAILHRQRHQEQREHHVIELRRRQPHRADLGLRYRRYPEIAAGHGDPFLQDFPDDPAESDCDHCQIGAAHAQGGNRENDTGNGGQYRAADDAKPDV